MSSKNKPSYNREVNNDRDDDDNEQLRKSFTPNWEETVNRTDGLPIKFNGKVLPNYKTAEPSSVDDDDESLHEESNENNTGKSKLQLLQL
jgi:hypothetical protein